MQNDSEVLFDDLPVLFLVLTSSNFALTALANGKSLKMHKIKSQKHWKIVIKNISVKLAVAQ